MDVAATLSNLGDGIVAPAFGLLAAALTRDPLLVSAVTAALWLPWLLVAPVAGALSDRWDRRRTMVAVDAVRFAVVAALGVAVLLDAASIWLLIVIAFLIGMAETSFDTSAEAIVPMVVPREPASLERANGWLQASEAVSNRLVGPPLGGVLFGVAPSVPFLLDAATFGLASAIISRLPGRYPPAELPEVRPTLRADVVEGIRWLWDHRLLRVMSVGAAIGNLALVAGEAVLVLFAQDVLGLGAGGYGVLLSAAAVGGLAGSVLALGMAPVGALLGGILGRVFGLAAPFVAGGALQIVISVPLFLALRRADVGMGGDPAADGS